MSDEDVARHMQLVRALSRSGQPLSAAGASATVRNAAWFTSMGRPRVRRRQLHEELVQRSLTPRGEGGLASSSRTADDPSGEGRFSGVAEGGRPHALVLAGPPGAGKSTVRTQLLGAAALRWVVIDADAFKDHLIDTALADGSYDTWIKPAQVHALEAAGERFFPLEMSALLQAESGLLARLQRETAMAGGRDVVVDTVLWDQAGALTLGADLQAAGYRISVVDVEVPYALSAARIEARWESVYRQALAGEDVRGGRWVPSEYARIVWGGPAGVDGASLCESSARALAEHCPAVTDYQRYRAVPAAGANRVQLLSTPAVLEEHLRRRRPGGPLHQVHREEASPD